MSPTTAGRATRRERFSRTGLYHRVKGSIAYDAYWRLADRRILEKRDAEIAFYRRVLAGFSPGALVFDVGANHGTKSDIFLRLGAAVVAIEPDRANQLALAHRFMRYRLTRLPFVLVRDAVSDRAGVETMWVEAPGSAKNTLSAKWVRTLADDHARFGRRLEFTGEERVGTVTLDQLIASHGRPFYVKIDVEGFETAVIRGLRQPVPFLSFEVNLPEFLPEGLACVALLQALAPTGTFNVAADCRLGLMLDRWLDARRFAAVLERCDEPSVEVFWTSVGR